MKKLSNRDWAIALIIGALAFLLGYCVKGLVDSRKEPVIIENPVNTALVKHSDSLEAIIAFRDMEDAVKAKKEALSDSILNKNHNILSKHYENLKDLDANARIRAYDSILANYKVRR